MPEDIIRIGLALETSQVLAGTRQVDAALKSVATASASTAQATKAMDQAARTAGQAMTTESQAAQAAGQALRQMAQASSGAGQAAVQLGQQVNTASGFLTRLGEQALAFGAGQAGIMGVAAAFGKVKDALTGAVQAAMNLESMTATFKAISGSSQAAEKDMAFLRQTATRLGIDFTSLSKGFTTLSASAQNTSLSGAALRDIFTAIAEKGRVLGKSADDINGALLAVGQSISKGTIQAEELRGQLSERLPGSFNDMARAMGVSTAELNKLLEAGKVGIENWAAWAAVVRRDLGSATEDASKTASAAIARLGNATGELSTRIGAALLPALTSTVDVLTSIVTAANSAAKALTSVDEARRKSLKEAETLAGGPGVSVDLQQKLVAAQDEVRKARGERQAMERFGEPLLMGGRAPGSFIEDARQRELAALSQEIELKRRLADINKAVKASDPLGEGGMGEPGARDEKRVAFQQQLVDQVRTNREELEKLDRVTQQLYGRKPTEDEILKVREKQVEETRKLIDANQQNWNLYKDTGPAKELRSQAAGAEALEKSIKAASDAVRDKGKAEREAEQERKRLEREAAAQYKEDLSTSLKQDEPFMQQVSDAADLLGELQRRTLALRHTEEERFAMRVEAMAKERPYLEDELQQAMKQYEKAKDFNDALRERNKLLQDQAAVSKGTLDDLNRLMKQLEPSRRSMTTEERLAGTRAEIATKSAQDPTWLARADEAIKKTLDTEIWDKWRDVGLDALDHVGKALEEFAFKGKLNFKGMMDSIAQDLFRFATQQLMQSATKKGGWLEMGLNLGLKVLGIAGAASGVPSSAIAQPASSASAGSVSSFAGLEAASGMTGTAGAYTFPQRQHGGPVSAGVPYWVGERGPELVVPRSSGTVVPAGQAQAPPQIVNHFHITTPDANSFTQSRGAVQRMIAHSVSQAYRGL